MAERLGTTKLPPPEPESVPEAERAAIMRALEETKGNRTKAAKILGISRRTLHNKLKEYGIR